MGRLVAIAAPLGIGIFLSVLDSAIVGVAYPAIEEDFGATSESTQWITTAYKRMLAVTGGGQQLRGVGR